jgi:two-component system chemotaxis sensor kinase CheA
MPLTLAIIRALLFKASGRLLALPLLAVSEIVRAGRGEITRLDGFENYRLRDRFISLVRPGLVLGFERRRRGPGKSLRGEADDSFIIVLSSGGKRYGILADEMLGDQELVIKPLEGRWVQNEALAGASVLGDGRVILILDAEMVLRKAFRYERSKGSGRVTYAG